MPIKHLGKIIYWLILAGLGLVAVFVGISALNLPGGYKLFTVRSGSMRPQIPTGSLVVVRPAADYQVGEVITFKNAPTPTTHRIQNISEGIYLTKGDANAAPDSETVTAEQIIGKALLAVPYAGYPVAFAKTKEGFMLLIVVPATMIIYGEALNIKNEIKKLRRKHG